MTCAAESGATCRCDERADLYELIEDGATGARLVLLYEVGERGCIDFMIAPGVVTRADLADAAALRPIRGFIYASVAIAYTDENDNEVALHLTPEEARSLLPEGDPTTTL